VTEAWLRGPVDGIDPLLMPAVHALMHAQEEIAQAGVSSLTTDKLWARPGGAGSIGFHLKHIANSIDRMLTYAHGRDLDQRQFAALRDEATSGGDAAPLVEDLNRSIARAIGEMRETPVATLQQPRTIGRKALPTTLFGILFHIGEHSARHAGQIVTLTKVVRG
jgi:uncharacterized damage-inducible protein DinB